MSAVDTMNNVHVGNFFNIPIYWIIESKKLSSLTDNDVDDNLTIDQYSLSIGGGSGEHPALVLNNDAIIFKFLTNIKDIPAPNKDSNEVDIFNYDVFTKVENIQNKFHKEYFYWTIDQNQWPLDSFVEVHRKFNRIQKNSFSLSEKIENTLAMFIIYEMPLEHCLKNKDILEVAKMIRSNRWQNIFEKDISYCFQSIEGVLNSQKLGKIIKNGKAVWGYSLNDWMNDHKDLSNKLSKKKPF